MCLSFTAARVLGRPNDDSSNIILDCLRDFDQEASTVAGHASMSNLLLRFCGVGLLDNAVSLCGDHVSKESGHELFESAIVLYVNEKLTRSV